MQEELLRQLSRISAEEQAILNGQTEVEKSIYTRRREFVIDPERMLQKGKLMDIRMHTRFVHFPRHSHDYIEMIYMCSGSTTHMINGTKQVVLEKGDLLFLNQHAVHEIEPAGEFDLAVNFIILPEFFDKAFAMIEEENVIRDFMVGFLRKKSGSADFIYFRVADLLPVQNLIENMIWSLVHRQSNVRNINQTTMGLLMLTLTNYTERIEGQSAAQYEKGLMFTVLRYVEEHYKNGSLTELAEQMNQSVAGLSRLIKQQCGRNFQQLMQQKRFSQASFLLMTTTLSVEEIILAVGYDNSSYFYRVFREKYGMTPKQYRKKCAKSMKICISSIIEE